MPYTSEAKILNGSTTVYLKIPFLFMTFIDNHFAHY